MISPPKDLGYTVTEKQSQDKCYQVKCNDSGSKFVVYGNRDIKVKNTFTPVELRFLDEVGYLLRSSTKEVGYVKIRAYKITNLGMLIITTRYGKEAAILLANNRVYKGKIGMDKNSNINDQLEFTSLYKEPPMPKITPMSKEEENTLADKYAAHKEQQTKGNN